MNSIREEAVALDTNEYVFALRADADHPACRTLVFDPLSALNIYLPLQVLLEVQRNLTREEMRRFHAALEDAGTIRRDYSPAPADLVRQWEERGAKKGDAVVAAHLDAASVRYFVSENRHFLVELADLPFEVLTAEEVLRRLG